MKSIFFVAALFACQLVVAQNVGVGTTTPQTQLHLFNPSGSSIFRAETNTALSQAAIELKTGTDLYDFFEIRKWMTGTGGSQAGIPLNGLSTLTTGYNSTAGLLLGTKREYPIYFTTDNIVRMQINETGNIGMGTFPTNAARLHVVTEDASSAIIGVNNFIATGTNYISSISGIISNNAVNGVGVSGTTLNAEGSSSSIMPGMYGVVGSAVDKGYGIGAFGVTGAGGIYATVISGSGKALRTFGPLLFEGIGAAAGHVLTSDALGNASWQNPATSHNHFGQAWSGSNAFSGLSISNTDATAGSTGISGFAQAPNGTGVYGRSTGANGTGVLGFVDHGSYYPPFETNSAVAGVNTTGNGVFATSFTGYSINAVKLNFSSTNGTVARFGNEKPSNTSPVVLIENNASNPTALELKNGYIKVSGANKTAFVHTTSAGNVNNNISFLNYPNAAATDMLFVTHNYSPVNTYFNYNYGVYWTGTVWAIYIETPATPMPVNINFNVMVIKQ